MKTKKSFWATGENITIFLDKTEVSSCPPPM